MISSSRVYSSGRASFPTTSTKHCITSGLTVSRRSLLSLPVFTRFRPYLAHFSPLFFWLFARFHRLAETVPTSLPGQGSRPSRNCRYVRRRRRHHAQTFICLSRCRRRHHRRFRHRRHRHGDSGKRRERASNFIHFFLCEPRERSTASYSRELSSDLHPPSRQQAAPASATATRTWDAAARRGGAGSRSGGPSWQPRLVRLRAAKSLRLVGLLRRTAAATSFAAYVPGPRRLQLSDHASRPPHLCAAAFCRQAPLVAQPHGADCRRV